MPDDQLVVIQTTNPNRPALWRLIPPARLKSMNLLSVRAVFVGRKGAGPGVKRLSSGFWNVTGKVHTEIVSNAAKKPLQAAIRGQGGPCTSSTRTAGGATMGWWIGGTKSISVWIMVSYGFARG